MTLFDDLQEHPIRTGLDLGRQQAQGLKGFSVTLRHLFRRPVTQAYPEHKRAVYPRFRGRHRLHRHPNGLEKCIGCSLCAAACPADCIRVVPAENEPDARVSPGERYARIYEINMARCIFCGYCEIACPFDAITLGNDFELSELSRDALVYTKQMLLDPPLRRTPAQDPEQFDRGAQEIEGAGVLGMYHVYSQNHDEVPAD
jgi:NADH-quinone oxidoreductase subunit I